MNKKFAVLSIVLASTFGFASQAMAHDEVGATSPAANSVVEAGKFDVSVTFGEDILQTKGNPGEVIEVVGPKDAGAEVQSNGCVAVDAKVLSTPVDLDKPGTYTVNWRSVSSDGHATEGTYDFKLQNTTGYLSDGVPAESEACSAQAPEALATENTDDGSIDSNLVGLGIGLGLVAAGTIAGALVVDRRNKKTARKAAGKATN